MFPLQPNMYYALAAVGAVIVVLLVAWLFRLARRGGSGDKGVRLGITEFYEIDKSRRLVLVRRDGVEHLVMIGGPQDLVIEKNIRTGLPEADRLQDPIEPLMQAGAPRRADDVVPFRAPRAPVFGAKRPPMLHSIEANQSDGDQTPA